GPLEDQVTDEKTVLLYALSTLAQTCAALAAFVGAVGLFRLQNLASERNEAEREFRGLVSRVYRTDPVHTPIEEFVAGLQDLLKQRDDVHVLAAKRAHERWNAFTPLRRRSQVGLVVFEGWNLLVIFAALVGFNYVPT